MSTNKLIISLTSPYARKVRIAALEKGLKFEVVVDVPWNEDTGIIALNPLGKVPVWITSQGESVYDSRVIVEYIDLQAGPALFPLSPIKRIQVKKIEALADGIMDASLCLFAERKKRPKELQHQWWIDRQFAKVHRGLQYLNDKVPENNFFHDTELSVADIAVASALGYVGLRFSEDFNWQEKYPKLAKFYEFHLKNENFQKTVPVV